MQSITRDLRNTRLFETASIGHQLVETLGKISKVTNHLLGDGGMSFETQFPVLQPNETQDEFNSRVVHLLKAVVSDVASGGVIVRIFLIFDKNSINNKATILCLHT